MFPYGAQYYRTPNPPEEEWEKDFKRMEEGGFTVVKLWAMWTWIHKGEGQFDWSHFDELFELAQKHGLKVVVSLILENAPYWLAEKFPDARYVAHDGTKIDLIARPNTPGGGWPGLCLHHPGVREEAENFMARLGSRYSGHSALDSYDVWDEAFFEPEGYFGERRFCYCPSTKSQFKDWLKEKYGSPEAVGEAWRRRYTAWEEIKPPRFLGGYPDWFDWLEFNLDNHKDLMEWRVDGLRKGDGESPIVSHGIAGTLGQLPHHYNDDWENAETVERWGVSSFPLWGVLGEIDPSFNSLRISITRSSARGKEIWQNELQGGPAQSGPETAPSGISRGAVPKGSDVAVWNWESLMEGCKGLMYWQWRSEALGPESPGFGLCHYDGTPTERTETAFRFARFLNRHQELKEADPRKGDLAILVCNESQLYNYVAEGDTEFYTDSLRGIYRALWENNWAVDFVKPGEMGKYELVYLPFPLCLKEDTAERIKDYVAQGGKLISEAGPARFGDYGLLNFTVPGFGLDGLFGCRELEFGPVGEGEEIFWGSGSMPSALHREKLELGDGEAVGRYEEGDPAIVHNRPGEGETWLIGTHLGLSCQENERGIVKVFLEDLLRRAGMKKGIEVSHPLVRARLHRGQERDFLYLLNLSEGKKRVEVGLKDQGYRRGKELENGEEVSIDGGRMELSLAGRSGTVMELF